MTLAPARRARVSCWRVVASGLAAALAVGGVVVAIETGGGSGVAGLDGNQFAGALASIPVRTGEVAAYTAVLRNDSGYAITLEAARLVPLDGFRLPGQSPRRLAVETGRVSAGAISGWPSEHHDRDMGLVPFAGYRVRSGHSVKILYGVSAAVPGDYATKALRLTVQVAGAKQSVDALSGSLTCVYPPSQLRHVPSCPGSIESRGDKAVASEP